MRSNNFLIYSFKLLLLFKIDKIFYTNVITILISYNTLKTSRLIVPALNTFLALFIRYSFYSFSLPFILRSCFDIKKSRNQVSRNLQRKSNMRNKKVAKDKISAICTNKKCKYHANVTIKGILRIWKARTSYHLIISSDLDCSMDCCLQSRRQDRIFLFVPFFAQNMW